MDNMPVIRHPYGHGVNRIYVTRLDFRHHSMPGRGPKSPDKLGQVSDNIGVGQGQYESEHRIPCQLVVRSLFTPRWYFPR